MITPREEIRKMIEGLDDIGSYMSNLQIASFKEGSNDDDLIERSHDFINEAKDKLRHLKYDDLATT